MLLWLALATACAAGPASPGVDEKLTFANAVMEAVRASGEMRPMHYDPAGFAVEIDVPGAQTGRTIFLFNSFAEWRRLDASARPELIRRLIGSTNAPEVPAKLADARASLLPVLRGRGYAFSARALFLKRGTPQDKLPECPRRPLSPFHHLGCALDSEDSLIELKLEHLATWKISLDEALEIAVNNLAAVSSEPFLVVSPGLYKAPWTDSYAASRLALPGLFRKLRVKGDPVALAPSRDHLYVAGTDDPAALAALLDTLKIPGATDRLISIAPVALRGERWTPFAPPAGHPLSLRFMELLRVADADDYTDQGEWLKAKLALEKRDVFVARCIVYGRKDGTSHSTATWTRGVPTLLPKVDAVTLVDADLPKERAILGEVPWDTFVQRVKGLKPMGLDPERYELPDFPSRELLEELIAPQR